MTFQPPPPPPPGPPAPPPPGGGYGPPAAGGGGSFDPKSVNTLDWAQLGIGVLVFIFGFVSFYSYSSKGGCEFGCADYHSNVWHGFFGWFALLLVLIATIGLAITLFAPQISLPVSARLAAVIAYVVALVCEILAIFLVPDLSVGGVSIPGKFYNKGHGFGFWISLILVAAGAVLAVMRAQQTNTKLPGPLNNIPKIG